jgi:hypothetical protein
MQQIDPLGYINVLMMMKMITIRIVIIIMTKILAIPGKVALKATDRPP